MRYFQVNHTYHDNNVCIIYMKTWIIHDWVRNSTNFCLFISKTDCINIRVYNIHRHNNIVRRHEISFVICLQSKHTRLSISSPYVLMFEYEFGHPIDDKIDIMNWYCPRKRATRLILLWFHTKKNTQFIQR